MDAYDCVATKLDVRNYSSKDVASDVIARVLEAARLASSGMNSQHRRFILVRDKENLTRLARASTTGKWVEGANFAVIVLTNPRYAFHRIDAGRAVEDMQLAAWNYGVVSCVFTGIEAEQFRKDFNIPEELSPTIVVGFGYPARSLTGKRKNRRPLQEVAFLEKYGGPLDRRESPNRLLSRLIWMATVALLEARKIRRLEKQPGRGLHQISTGSSHHRDCQASCVGDCSPLVRRGDIYWTDIGTPAGRRPVLNV